MPKNNIITAGIYLYNLKFFLMASICKQEE